MSLHVSVFPPDGLSDNDRRHLGLIAALMKLDCSVVSSNVDCFVHHVPGRGLRYLSDPDSFRVLAGRSQHWRVGGDTPPTSRAPWSRYRVAVARALSDSGACSAI